MAALWIFQNVRDPAICAAGVVDMDATRIEVRDHEETGTRTYEALDYAGPSPRSIGRYRTLVDAKAACQRHTDQKRNSRRDAPRPTESHEELKRLLARESAKA
jgi:hypothetical protein